MKVCAHMLIFKLKMKCSLECIWYQYWIMFHCDLLLDHLWSILLDHLYVELLQWGRQSDTCGAVHVAFTDTLHILEFSMRFTLSAKKETKKNTQSIMFAFSYVSRTLAVGIRIKKERSCCLLHYTCISQIGLSSPLDEVAVLSRMLGRIFVCKSHFTFPEKPSDDKTVVSTVWSSEKW